MKKAARSFVPIQIYLRCVKLIERLVQIQFLNAKSAD